MDYYQIDKTKAANYIAGDKAITGKVFQGGDKEKQLEAIITQKWMAIFPNGNEGWADFRRTDYPAWQTNSPTLVVAMCQRAR